MANFVKVMFDTKSGADFKYKYKVGEVNVAKRWNPNADNPKDFGGFNFSTDTKILRWMARGDTLYDVEVPDDAEVVDVPNPTCPHGLLRTNKIIVKNPRKLTDELVMDLYEKSDLTDKSYFIAILCLAMRGFMNTCKRIVHDKITKENLNEAYSTMLNYANNNTYIPGQDKHIDELVKELEKIREGK